MSVKNTSPVSAEKFDDLCLQMGKISITPTIGEPEKNAAAKTIRNISRMYQHSLNKTVDPWIREQSLSSSPIDRAYAQIERDAIKAAHEHAYFLFTLVDNLKTFFSPTSMADPHSKSNMAQALLRLIDQCRQLSNRIYEELTHTDRVIIHHILTNNVLTALEENINSLKPQIPEAMQPGQSNMPSPQFCLIEQLMMSMLDEIEENKFQKVCSKTPIEPHIIALDRAASLILFSAKKRKKTLPSLIHACQARQADEPEFAESYAKLITLLQTTPLDKERTETVIDNLKKSVESKGQTIAQTFRSMFMESGRLAQKQIVAKVASQNTCSNPDCSLKGNVEKNILLELKICKGCYKALYCSRECQKAHWKEHKIECQTTARV